MGKTEQDICKDLKVEKEWHCLDSGGISLQLERRQWGWRKFERTGRQESNCGGPGDDFSLCPKGKGKPLK